MKEGSEEQWKGVKRKEKGGFYRKGKTASARAMASHQLDQNTRTTALPEHSLQEHRGPGRDQGWVKIPPFPLAPFSPIFFSPNHGYRSHLFPPQPLLPLFLSSTSSSSPLVLFLVSPPQEVRFLSSLFSFRFLACHLCLHIDLLV